MRYLLAVLLSLIICSQVSAEDFFKRHEVSLGYGPGCKHWDSGDYNEKNNHLFMLTFDSFFMSTFRNSSGNRSYAGGYKFRTRKWELNSDLFVRGNLPIGLVYGYDKGKMFGVAGFSPFTIPTLELGYNKVSIHFAALPVMAAMLSVTF